MSAFVPARLSGTLVVPSKAVLHTRLTFVLILLAFAGALFLARLVWPARAELAMLPSVDSARPAILLRGTSVERRLGYLSVTGELQNRSGRELQHVEAVVEYYDKSGRLIRVDSALIEVPRLVPGGDSAFEIHSRDSAAISGYRVQFRTLSGSVLPSSSR